MGLAGSCSTMGLEAVAPWASHEAVATTVPAAVAVAAVAAVAVEVATTVPAAVAMVAVAAGAVAVAITAPAAVAVASPPLPPAPCRPLRAHQHRLLLVPRGGAPGCPGPEGGQA